MEGNPLALIVAGYVLEERLRRLVVRHWVRCCRLELVRFFSRAMDDGTPGATGKTYDLAKKR